MGLIFARVLVLVRTDNGNILRGSGAAVGCFSSGSFSTNVEQESMREELETGEE